MTPERWQRISAIFHDALAESPDSRQAFLDGKCGDDRDLYAEIERLLAAHARAGTFGESPVFARGDAAGTSLRSEADDAGGPRGVFFFVALLLVLVSAVLFADGLRLLLAARGTVAVLGWQPAVQGGHFYVAGIDPDGPAAGRVELGDRVVRLNEAPGSIGSGLAAERGTLAIGDSYDLVVERAGVEHTLRLPVVGARDTARLTYFIASFIWCSIGLFVGVARPQSVLARLACLASLATGFVFLQATFVPGWPLLQPLHAVLGYHFLTRFPSGSPSRGIWRGVLVTSYVLGGLAAALGLALNLVPLDGSAEPIRAGIIAARGPALLVSYTAAVFGMPLALVHNYRRLEDADQRRRVRWVLYAGVVALAPQLWWAAVYAFEYFAGPTQIPRFDTFANTATAAIPLAMAYAVVKHRVLDIKVVVRRGMQYLLARRALQAAVLLPFAALLFIVIRHRDLTLAELATQTGAYVFWLAAAGVALRFRRPIRLWLDRRFFREEYDREQLVTSLLDASRRAESLADLSRAVSDTLAAALHPSGAYVWYRDPRERAATAAANVAAPELPADERWLAWLERRAALASLPVSSDAGLSHDDVRRLEKRGIDAIMPIADSGDRLVGALLLGPKRSEQPYNEADSRFLAAVAKQAAVIRENLGLRARLGEELRVRREVLGRLDGQMPDLLKECPECGACHSGSIETCPFDGQSLVLSLPVARTVDERYRLDRLIGKGGMGAVYEARDLRLDRVVALKIMLSRAFGQPGALRRFRREARTAARLSHPSIVTVFDVGSLEGEGAYIVMERVHGETLRAALERATTLTPAAAAEWFVPLLDGLAAAHGQGIVHRDLKPENVMGQRDDAGRLSVKILDLGLVKLRGAESDLPGTMTRDGAIMGTPDYMSPEQLLGREVDHRSDLFAIGVMLLESLTGERALPSGTTPRALPPELWDLVRRCLCVEPSDRPPAAAAVRDELLPLLPRGESAT